MQKEIIDVGWISHFFHLLSCFQRLFSFQTVVGPPPGRSFGRTSYPNPAPLVDGPWLWGSVDCPKRADHRCRCCASPSSVVFSDSFFFFANFWMIWRELNWDMFESVNQLISYQITWDDSLTFEISLWRPALSPPSGAPASSISTSCWTATSSGDRSTCPWSNW